jgi:hypothetical protein
MKLFRRPRHRRLRPLPHLRRSYQHHLRAPKHRRRPHRHRHPAPAKAQAQVLPPDRKWTRRKRRLQPLRSWRANRQRLEPSLTLNPFRTQPTLLCYFVGNAHSIVENVQLEFEGSGKRLCVSWIVHRNVTRASVGSGMAFLLC